MKTNLLIKSIILLSSIYLFILNINMSYVTFCEGFESSTLDNNFWKIEEIKTNVWHVLFRNVGIKYEVCQCQEDNDIKTSLFEFREIGPNYTGIFNPDYILKMIDLDVFKYWAANNQGYEIAKDDAIRLTGSADSNYVFFREHHNNIVDATMEHFNNIQRGVFHPNAENVINPNSHGRATNVLDTLKTMYGANYGDVWLNSKNNGMHNNTTITSKLSASASVPISKNINPSNTFYPNSISKSPSSSHITSCSPIPQFVSTQAHSCVESRVYNDLGGDGESNRFGKSKYLDKSFWQEPVKSLSQQLNQQTNQKADQQVRRDVRSPLDQFLIKDLLIIIMPLLANLYISYTNMSLYITIATLIIIVVYLFAINLKKIQTGYWYITIESLYVTLYSIVINQINTIKGQNFFPFVYCLFIFILINNLIGMVPYSFAPTSHFILTFFISFTIVFGSTILGFILHNLKFFSLLVPNGCPLGLLPLLVLIETVSYLARNVSLGLRLAANILSGHMLLNILSEFTYKIMDTNAIYFFLGMIPLMFIGAFSALELGIAFIQSQVFVVLSSSYTKDSLELH